MKDKLILKNGAEIEMESGAILSAIKVRTDNRSDMKSTWEQLTSDNLSEIQIKNSAGVTVGKYTDIVLVSETSVVADDGSVLTTYSLREKSDTEKRLDAVETAVDVHDEAIGDLAATTSAVAEQLEGGTE